MRNRTKAALAGGVLAFVSAGFTAGAAVAATSGPTPVNDLTKPVYACVNSLTGRIDYLEFRGDLPHACWFRVDRLWELSAAPAPAPAPTPSPSDS